MVPKSIQRIQTLVALLLLFSLQSVFAQDAPIKLFGKVDTTGGNVSIKLNWQNISAGKADTFSIHRAVFEPGVVPSGTPPKYIDVIKDSSFTDKLDKVSGYTYVYLVKARTGKIPLPLSNIVTIAFPNIVVKPPVLYASVMDSGKVNLIWSAPLNFTPLKYLIYRGPFVKDTPFNFADAKAIDSVNANSSVMQYQDKVVPGSYGYFVRAVDQKTSLTSNAMFVKIEAPVLKTEYIYLSGNLDTARIAHLKWSVPVNGSVSRYYMYRYYNASTTVQYESNKFVLFDSSVTPTYDEKTKLNFGLYAYAVRAVTSTKTPVESNVFVLKIEQSQRLDNFVLYAAPTKGGVKLQWTIPNGYTIAKYFIKRLGKSKLEESTDRKNFVAIDSVGGGVSTYIDSLKNGSSPVYSYFIEALTSDNKTLQSYIANVVISEKIVLSLLPSFDGSLKLSWTKLVSAQSQYTLVYRNTVQKSAGVLDSMKWVQVDSVTNFEWNDYVKNLGNATLVGYLVSVKMTNDGFLYSNGVVMPIKTTTPEPFTLTGRADRNQIKLKWNPSPLSQTDRYFVYQAKPTTLKIDSTLVFTVLDSTKDREWNKTVSANAQDRIFAFYIEARGAGNKARTNGVLITILKDQNVDVVKIVTEPGEEAVVGKQYVYQAKAVSSDTTATFTWLRGTPVIPGMTLDITGKVLWTPTNAGWVKTVIGVKSNKGGFASQTLEIRVTDAKVAKGSVHGTVNDSLGNAIPFVVVRLFQHSSSPFEYAALSDSLGNFKFRPVAAGNYKAFASPVQGNFLPVWYPNAKSADQAEKIVVAESSDVVLNFILQSREHVIPKYNISGFVNDTAGAAIPGAVVVFARAEFIFNAAKKSSDSSADLNYRQLFRYAFLSGMGDGFRFDGLSREIFRTFTDSTGKYSMKIPKGAYVGITFAQGYRRLLYNNKTDLLSADMMRLSTDTTNINFTLTSRPTNVVLGGIGGVVQDSSSGTGVPARVIAYRDKGDNRISDAYYVDSDTAGVYNISDLPAGQYIVFAIPLGSYAPSFYSTLGTTLKWKNATKLDINGSMISGADIFVKPITNRNEGFTFINGTVVTPLSPGGNSPVTLQGVNGTTVSVSDANGDVVGYGVTDEAGNFNISNLAPGTYTVTVDRFGYQSTSSISVSPTYDSQGNSVPASAAFTIANDSPNGVVVNKTTALPTEYKLEQNFPNPFNPTTTIRFNLPQTVKASLTIYNILGQKVATLVDGVIEAGAHNISWNASNVASGIYFYQVKTDNFTATKKMMLIK